VKFFMMPILLCFILSLLLTPLVKRVSIKIGAIDKPDERKVHKKIMPRMGGLAIIISFIFGCLVFIPNSIQIWPILLGVIIIAFTGLLDDMYSLSPRMKLLGQILAATVAVLGGVQIEFITTPSGEIINFGWFSIPLTIIWIVAIINAINLIDGLDGLAAGVTSIATITISILALTLGHPLTFFMGIILLGSTLGFLVFNFYPAKIFMGDTGSLFLGYMISVLSVMGLTKSAAIFSLVLPIIILAVPIMDTTFAIIRRIVQKKPLSAPDKFHLHHCLIRLGFSHKQSVLLIYLLSAIFSLAAILFTRATIWGASILIVLLLILVELIVEVTGLISANYRPILNLMESRRNQQSDK
jgi:UDP-GlcNAc:undecaprenyl-phosphate/decaprenyl-phosphate GlcNAc-1-phosphate transferase